MSQPETIERRALREIVECLIEVVELFKWAIPPHVGAKLRRIHAELKQ